MCARVSGVLISLLCIYFFSLTDAFLYHISKNSSIEFFFVRLKIKQVLTGVSLISKETVFFFIRYSANVYVNALHLEISNTFQYCFVDWNDVTRNKHNYQ